MRVRRDGRGAGRGAVRVGLDGGRDLVLLLERDCAREERVVLPPPDAVEAEQAERDDARDAADDAADDRADVARARGGDGARGEGERGVAALWNVEDAVEGVMSAGGWNNELKTYT